MRIATSVLTSGDLKWVHTVSSSQSSRCPYSTYFEMWVIGRSAPPAVALLHVVAQLQSAMPLSDAPRSDAVPITERLRAAKDGCVGCARTLAKNPSRSMKIASVVSGLLLVLGGFYGMFNLFFPLQAVISVYQLLFGILILVTELKSWPIISTFQKKVDVWFHLLSTTRGKGGFYCFIGLLAFCASEWSLARVCVLIVTIVGVVHLLGNPKQPAGQHGCSVCMLPVWTCLSPMMDRLC